LLEKGHSVLAIGQNAGEVAGIKFKLKRFPKNIDTITLYLKRGLLHYIVETKPKRVLSLVLKPGTISTFRTE
jgi:hypothetical protein